MSLLNIKNSFRKLKTPLSSNRHLPFNFSGRFGRLSYITWITLLCVSSFTMMTYLSMKMFQADLLDTDSLDLEIGHGPDLLALFLLTVLYISVIYLFFVFTIRRLHDLNRSGWFSLITLIPFIQFIFFLYLLIIKGSISKNRYGDLRITPTWEKVCAIVSIICTPLIIIGCTYIFSVSKPVAPTTINEFSTTTSKIK